MKYEPYKSPSYEDDWYYNKYKCVDALHNSVGALVEPQYSKTKKGFSVVSLDLRPNRIQKRGNMGTFGMLMSRPI